MTIAFHMTADQALKFCELAKELNLQTDEELVILAQEMNLVGFTIAVTQTKRSPEQIAKDYSKHCQVLYVKLEDKNETGIDPKDIN